MPARFSATHATAAASNKTLLEVFQNSTNSRLWIYELEIAATAPADLAGQFDVIRGTVSGTGTAITPRKLEPLEATGSGSAVGGTITGQTKTANSALLSIALHQRATFRWIAKPSAKIVIPRTPADHWVGIECIAHGGTPSIASTMFWEE